MTRSDLLIVPMTTQHLAACVSLVDQTPLLQQYGYQGQRAHDSLHQALTDSRARLRVALVEHQPAGFTWFVLRGAFDRSGYLRLIVIHPAFQGRGVGVALLQALERDHLDQGGLMLLCADGNPAAQRFYERCGYLHVGTLPSYVKPGMDERIYFKAP